MVTIDQLAEDLWEDRPPGSVRSNIKTYIAGLRGLLSPEDPTDSPILTSAGGYRIQVAHDELDILEFDRLVKAAREGSAKGDLTNAVWLFGKALDLWRGQVLEDVSLTETLSVAVTGLTEARLDALSDWADVRLALGDHTGLVERLRDGIREDPYRERLYAQLMLALYRQNRPGEALTTYNDLRKRLADDLGTDPTKPLLELYQQILISDPDLDPAPIAPVTATGRTGPVPRQLPINVPLLLGRDAETTKIEYVIASGTQTGAPPVIAISGTAGVGKSALAVHAAHIVRDTFSDGQLYVNLHGATPGVPPLRPHEALARFLKVLGVPASDVPNDLNEAAALYRTLLADRKILIILDDAATVDQVRPLLPSGPGCAAIITGRKRMSSLQHAVQVDLATLSPGDAVAMLKHLAGARVDTDLLASERLAALVGHLPLGLHIAAARLKARPDWTVQHLIDRLDDEHGRLRELRTDDITIGGSLSVSYFALRNSYDPSERAAADAFRLLGSLNSPTFTTPVIAALLGAPLPDADLVVERLLTSHLIESPAPGRFAMHDLVRLCARERAVAELEKAQLDQALAAVLGFYIVTAKDAVYLMDPHREQFPIPNLETEPLTFFEANDGLQWLDDERANMVTLILQAFAGTDELCCLGLALTRVLHWFLIYGGYSSDRLTINEPAIEVARRLQDRRSEAYALGHIALTLMQLDRHEEAIPLSEHERALCRDLGDRFGEQRALANLGWQHLRLGRLAEAVKYSSQQLEMARAIQASNGERFALITLGTAYRQLGRLHEARVVLEEAYSNAQAHRDDVHLCWTLRDLSSVYEDLGQFSEMKRLLVDAIKIIRRTPDRDEEPDMYIGLARAHRLLGEREQAITNSETALRKLRAIARRPFEAKALEEYRAARAMSQPQSDSND